MRLLVVVGPSRAYASEVESRQGRTVEAVGDFVSPVGSCLMMVDDNSGVYDSECWGL